MEPRLHDLTLEIIQRCPNSCLFCSSLASTSSHHRLSFDEIMHVSDQAVSLGLQTIGISGGEPLLHPSINEIIPALNERLRVRLYTTGICFDANGRASGFYDWSSFDPSKTTIIFNVQSTEASVHDVLTRQQGSLQLTSCAIRSAKKSGFRVEVHLVPNRLNLPTIESSVADLADWGIDQISFLRLVPQGNAQIHASQLLLGHDEREQLKELFQRLEIRDFDGTKLRFGIPFSGLLHENAPCNAASTKLIVRYDGVVLPCEAFKCAPDGCFELGDIRSHSFSKLLARGQLMSNLNALKREVGHSHETCPAQIFWAGVNNHYPCLHS